MVLTKPGIYYRDTDSKKTTYPDAESVKTNFPAQYFEFTQTTFVIENMKFAEEHNNPRENSKNPDNTYKIHKQQNGILGLDFTITGHFDLTAATSYLTLLALLRTQQIENSYHKFGTFGFFHPTCTVYNLDPTNTKGLTPDVIESGFSNQQPTIIPFSIKFTRGGVVV